MKSSSLHLRLIYLCTSPWPWTPGVVKTAAKAFPDVAAQCQEKKIPGNPRRFCLPHRRRVQVKEDGNTFFKTNALFLVLARCFKVWETFVNLINTYLDITLIFPILYMAGVQNSRSKGLYKVGPIGIEKLILHLRYEAGPIGNHAVHKLGASIALAWR